jgi:hypothetical protein
MLLGIGATEDAASRRSGRGPAAQRPFRQTLLVQFGGVTVEILYCPT